MSQVLQGARSKSYAKDLIPGISNSQDQLQHVSVADLPGDRLGMDVVIHGTYEVSTGHTIDAGSVQRKIISAGHGLPVGSSGYVLVPTSGNASGEEVNIMKVEDANTLILAVGIDASLGDTFSIKKYITPNYTATGDLNVVVNGSGPVQFKKDGVTTDVSYDTTIPPNSDALPVNIVTVNGQGISTTVDLSGAQINVQLSDRGSTPDAVRIGDGTNLVAINASNEMLVHDQGLDDTINNIDFASEATLALLNGKLASLLLTDFATENTLAQMLVNLEQKANLTDVQPVSLPAGESTKLTNIQDSTDLTANALGLPNDSVATTDTGSFSIISFIKRSMQNWTSLLAKLPALVSGRIPVDGSGVTQPTSSAQLPTTLGSKTSANSLSIAPASDAVFNVKPKALTNSFAEFPTLTTIQTFTAPANAIGGKIQASSDNLGNVRYQQGGTVSTSSGVRLEAGRAEDFIGGSNITVISESGTNYVCVNWTIQA